MLTNSVRAVVQTSVGLVLLGNIVFAVIIHDTVRFELPIQAIHGRVSNHGNAIPSVWVDVYDNAQVCLDHSMTPAEKRKRQTKIASVKPKADGEFSIKHLPKGFYEVEFGNHGMGGYNVLSVLVNVDPKGKPGALCVNLGLEGDGQSSVFNCFGK
jgi:hypothetical protein